MMTGYCRTDTAYGDLYFVQTFVIAARYSLSKIVMANRFRISVTHFVLHAREL